MKNLARDSLVNKFKILFWGMVLVFTLAVTAQADTWNNVVDLNAIFDGGSLDLDGAVNGQIHQGFNTVTYNWEHLTPADFEVPWDTVSSATLSVWVGWIDTVGDDHLDVQTLSLPLIQNTATYSLDIGTLFVSLWPTGQNLQASLTITEDERTISHPEWNGDLLLGTSTFAMEYENRAAPVPEPCALILLGCGLIGIGVFRRISKKS